MSSHWPSACALLLFCSLSGLGDSCSSKSDKEKLDEWRRLAKIHRQDTEENIINQSNSGVSLFNFQWASFASGASALRVIALICGLVIICCLWKAKAGRRRRKNQERLLAAISTISSPSGGSSPPGRPPVPTTNQPLSLAPTGSAPRQDGPLYPHNTLPDPVAFRGSRFPSSHHFYTTGTSLDVDIPPPEERPLRCGPSQRIIVSQIHGNPG